MPMPAIKLSELESVAVCGLKMKERRRKGPFSAQRGAVRCGALAVRWMVDSLSDPNNSNPGAPLPRLPSRTLLVAG